VNGVLYGFCKAAYLAFSTVFHPVKVIGKEYVPAEGKVIICANHQSLQDPLLLATYLKRRLHFMAQKELFKNKLFGKFLGALGAFPVARGENDLSAIRTSFKLLAEDKALGIFPEGTRFHDGEMHALQNGVAMLALRGKSPVVPAYIEGDYRLFRKMKLIVGEPVDLSDLGGKCDQETIAVVSARIREKMISLSGKQ